MSRRNANGYLIAVAFFLACCWINPNDAIPYRTRLQAIDQMDQRVKNKMPDTSAMNFVDRAIEQPDSGEDKKPTLSGGGKKWRFSQRPRSPRSRIKNVNTNVNINTFHQPHKTDSRSVVTPASVHQKTNMDPLTLETVNCSEPHNANDRYSSSFSGNGSVQVLNVGDDFQVAGEAGTKRTSSVHVGEDITLCWIETTTIKEDRTSHPIQRLVLREYTISFENSATIPERYLECVKLEGEVDWKNDSVPKSALFEVMDENTRHSRVVNFTTVSHSDDLTVWQHRRVRCGVGPVVTKNIIEWADERSDNPKKRVEIKVSPRVHRLSAQPTDTEPCTTDLVGLQQTSTTPKHHATRLECGPGTTCDSDSDCVDDSCSHSSTSDEYPGGFVPQTESPQVYTTVRNIVGIDAPVVSTTARSEETESDDILSTGVTKESASVTNDMIDPFSETTTAGSVISGTTQSEMATEISDRESSTSNIADKVPTTTENGILLSVTLSQEDESESVQADDHKIEPPLTRSESDESYFNTHESNDYTESCENGKSCAETVSSEGSFIYSSEERTTVETDISDSAPRKDSVATDTEEFTTPSTENNFFTTTNTDEEEYSAEEERMTTVATPREITETSTTTTESTESQTAITASTQSSYEVTEPIENERSFTESSESSTTTTEMTRIPITETDQTENISATTITEPTEVYKTFTESMEDVNTMREETNDSVRFTGSTESSETTTQAAKDDSMDIDLWSVENSGMVTETTVDDTTTTEAMQTSNTMTERSSNANTFTSSTDRVIETIAELPEGYSTTTTAALKNFVGNSQSTECDPSLTDCEVTTGRTIDTIEVGSTEKDSDTSSMSNESVETAFPKIDGVTSMTGTDETTENLTSPNSESVSDGMVSSTTETTATETTKMRNEKIFEIPDFTSEISARKKTSTDEASTTSKDEYVENISITSHTFEDKCDDDSTTCKTRSDQPTVANEEEATKMSELLQGMENTPGGPDSSSIDDGAIGEFITSSSEITTTESLTRPRTIQPTTYAHDSYSMEETSVVNVLTTTEMPVHEISIETISHSHITENAKDSRQYTTDRFTEVVSTTRFYDDDISTDDLGEGSTAANADTVTVRSDGESVNEYSTPPSTVTPGGTEEPVMAYSTTPSSVTVGGSEEPIVEYSTISGTAEPVIDYSTTPNTEVESTTKESANESSETTPHPCDPDTESCESKEESTYSSCDEETGSCPDDSSSTIPCDEESGSCSTDLSMSFAMSNCDEESSDCSTGTTLVLTTECDENSSASCTSSIDTERFTTSGDGSEICGNSPAGICTRDNSYLATTSSTPIGVENVSTTVSDVPTTVESRRSTTVKAMSTDSTLKHKLALKIKILLEHIDENKKKQKLVEVEKHLLFDEDPDEHGQHSLMNQVRSLNNSVDMRTVQALFNCSAIEKLTGDVGEFAAKYLAMHSGLKKMEESAGNVTESAEVHVRKPRDLNPSENSEVDPNLEMSLPGIHADIHAGFDHVLSRLPSGHEVEKRSAEAIEEEIPRSRIFKMVADPQDERVHTRRKKQTIEDLTIDQKDLPEEVREVGHWSNERMRRATDGSHVRTLTEFTIYKGP